VGVGQWPELLTRYFQDDIRYDTSCPAQRSYLRHPNFTNIPRFLILSAIVERTFQASPFLHDTPDMASQADYRDRQFLAVIGDEVRAEPRYQPVWGSMR